MQTGGAANSEWTGGAIKGLALHEDTQTQALVEDEKIHWGVYVYLSMTVWDSYNFVGTSVVPGEWILHTLAIARLYLAPPGGKNHNNFLDELLWNLVKWNNWSINLSSTQSIQSVQCCDQIPALNWWHSHQPASIINVSMLACWLSSKHPTMPDPAFMSYHPNYKGLTCW